MKNNKNKEIIQNNMQIKMIDQDKIIINLVHRTSISNKKKMMRVLGEVLFCKAVELILNSICLR